MIKAIFAECCISILTTYVCNGPDSLRDFISLGRGGATDAEQRVTNAGREVRDELAKLNAFAATARREASEARQEAKDVREVELEGPGGSEGLNTFLRNNAEVFEASEAAATAAANKVRPRDPRTARERWMDRETAKHIPEFRRILEGARRRDPKAMRQLRRLNGEDVESPSESESEETASDDSSDDDEPMDTEPEPAKPKVAPGAVPVFTWRGPDGSMRVEGDYKVRFHNPDKDARPSESEETASDDSEGIRPWDPD